MPTHSHKPPSPKVFRTHPKRQTDPYKRSYQSWYWRWCNVNEVYCSIKKYLFLKHNYHSALSDSFALRDLLYIAPTSTKVELLSSSLIITEGGEMDPWRRVCCCCPAVKGLGGGCCCIDSYITCISPLSESTLSFLSFTSITILISFCFLDRKVEKFEKRRLACCEVVSIDSVGAELEFGDRSGMGLCVAPPKKDKFCSTLPPFLKLSYQIQGFG